MWRVITARRRSSFIWQSPVTSTCTRPARYLRPCSLYLPILHKASSSRMTRVCRLRRSTFRCTVTERTLLRFSRPSTSFYLTTSRLAIVISLHDNASRVRETTSRPSTRRFVFACLFFEGQGLNEVKCFNGHKDILDVLRAQKVLVMRGAPCMARWSSMT